MPTMRGWARFVRQGEWNIEDPIEGELSPIER